MVKKVNFSQNTEIDVDKLTETTTLRCNTNYMMSTLM